MYYLCLILTKRFVTKIINFKYIIVPFVNLEYETGISIKSKKNEVSSKEWFLYFSELMKLQELMKLRNQNNIKITLQQYSLDFQYNKILKDIRKKGETNIVLEVPTSRIKDVLTEVIFSLNAIF